jgi:hypothetical protein
MGKKTTERKKKVSPNKKVNLILKGEEINISVKREKVIYHCNIVVLGKEEYVYRASGNKKNGGGKN